MTRTFILIIILVFAFFFWQRQRRKKIARQFGLEPQELALLQQYSKKGDDKSAHQLIATVQERARDTIQRETGVDVRTLTPEIGREISWADIARHAFRVFEFDKADTTIDQNYQIHSKSKFKPYGYLLVGSPILNQRARLPIIHRDDFLLAASVFDEPNLAQVVNKEELLVTYAPKHLLSTGLSGSAHHVLHYVIAPRGTLDDYYAFDNDIHMKYPVPEKLFGPFVYEGDIRVQVNNKPSF